MKMLRLHEPVYNIVIYGFASTPQALAKAKGKRMSLVLKEVGDPSRFAGFMSTITEDDGEHPFIWVDLSEPKSRHVGLLAHEVLHLTFSILRDRGVRYSKKSEEAFTYLHGWLMQSLQPLVR